MKGRREFLKSAAGVATAAITPSVTAFSRQNQGSSENQLPRFPEQSRKRDYWNKPFRVVVALGESTTAGGTATSRELTWVSRLGELITESQLEPVKMINSGIGANVISRRSPEYENSGKPSAMERYKKHVIEHGPDLALFSYGLNDARGGTPLAQFLEDVRFIVSDIKDKTRALVVILNAYFMTGFDRYVPFNKANVATFLGYNAALRRLAEETDSLYADVFEAEGMAPWMIDPDGVHPNNLGHRVIANRVFEVLAKNCSGLSLKAFEMRKNFQPWRDESVLRKIY